MRLRVLRNPPGAIDGLSLAKFRAGQIYEFGPRLACVFLAEGWAEALTDDDRPVPVRPPPSGPAGVKRLVLVVDDDPDLRLLAEALLTAHGYRVVLAQHGGEAIRRLREQCPSLIILDLQMPVMNGWQFRERQQRLRNRALAAVPVLLMTGVPDARSHADALRAVGVVPKPFESGRLLAAVAAALESKG